MIWLDLPGWATDQMPNSSGCLLRVVPDASGAGAGGPARVTLNRAMLPDVLRGGLQLLPCQFVAEGVIEMVGDEVRIRHLTGPKPDNS